MDPAAHLLLEAGDQKEATVCLKFRTFAYNEGFGFPFHISTECPDKNCVDWFTWNYMVGWKTGMEDDGKQAGHTEIFFSHDNQTSKEQTIQMAEKTRWHFNLYEDWLDLFEWQSACYSFSVVKRIELVYVNGKFIQGYQWPKQFKKGWGDYPLRLKLMMNWRGEVTDLNIYDSAFDDKELIARTNSCEEPAEGEIFAWNPEKFNLTNDKDTETILSEVSASELCSSEEKDKNILEVFDNGKPKSALQSEQICARLNGKLNLVPVTEEEGFATLNEMIDYAVNINYTLQIALYVAGRAFPRGDTDLVVRRVEHFIQEASGGGG